MTFRDAMHCHCGQALTWKEIEEVDDTVCFGRCECVGCQFRLGIEAKAKEMGALLEHLFWTDEALHALDRLPPYAEPLVREDVEQYAQTKGVHLVTSGLLTESKNRGAVAWTPEAEQRLERVPGAVRAMARIELERTAMDRSMPEVTVDLMEEVKARYFGMGAAQSK